METAWVVNENKMSTLQWGKKGILKIRQHMSANKSYSSAYKKPRGRGRERERERGIRTSGTLMISHGTFIFLRASWAPW